MQYNHHHDQGIYGTNWYGTEVRYVVWYKILHIPLTIPHTIPYQMHKLDKKYILKLSFAWKTLLNMSQCITKPTNDVCHVETSIRLKCEKYSVINGTLWYGMWYSMRFCSIPHHTIPPYHTMKCNAPTTY